MINKTPFFSIVIPTFNHANFISRCLESILAQSFQNWEAIIVNNFSSDNTIEVVASYNDPRIHLVNNANGGIIAVSRNKGIALARGEWICFLDSDDWWTSNKLEICLPYLQDYDMLYHDMLIFSGDNKKKVTLKGRSLKKLNPFEDMLLRGNPCINSSVVIRRSVIDTVGNISEDKALVAVEDFDYWLRVSNKTTRLKYIAKNLGYYYLGGSNISFNEKQIARIDSLYIKHLKVIKSERLRHEIIKRTSYRQARIYYLLGLYEQAYFKFHIALRSNQPRTSLRSLLFIILIKIRSNVKK